MLNKLALHQYVLFGVLIILTLWSLVSGDFVFNLGFLWWILGAIIGFLFVFTDRLINKFLMKPDEMLGLKLKEIIEQKKIKEGLLLLLNERYEQKELVMRSFLFLVVWVVLSFLTVTSVTSTLARGFVLGIGTHLVFDLVYDYLWVKEKFEQWFWQIKRPLSDQEKRGFVFGMVAVYLILAFQF
jgi:hypothetical protein